MKILKIQFINVHVQYFGETQDRDLQIKKIHMTFYVVWIHNNKRNIGKNMGTSKKVDSKEAVMEKVAFLYSRLLTIDWFGWESWGNLICLATSNYVCIDF